MGWFFLAWQRFAEFGGRSRRMEYWMYTLFYFIILIALYLGIFGFGLAHLQALGAICTFLSIAYAFVAFIPGLACAVRRLHDSGKTGWWILLGIVPVADIVLLVFLCLDGDAGENRYGPNPKATGQTTAIG